MKQVDKGIDCKFNRDIRFDNHQFSLDLLGFCISYTVRTVAFLKSNDKITDIELFFQLYNFFGKRCRKKQTVLY